MPDRQKGMVIAMKTIEEMYKEISDSEELQKELKEASDEMLKVFLEKHGCDADVKDFTEYAKSQEEGEMEDNDVEAIVGGVYLRPASPVKPTTVV